jgi:4-alpha-glucanotransferase
LVVVEGRVFRVVGRWFHSANRFTQSGNQKALQYVDDACIPQPVSRNQCKTATTPNHKATMKLSRSAGVLLHPTSLPSPDGIGTLGSQARAFVDRLSEAGQTWWQVLPLSAPGHGGSPYSGTSAFAGNDLLVDLAPLVDRGWLTVDEVGQFRRQIADLDPNRLPYDVVAPEKGRLLDLACERWRDAGRGDQGEYEAFVERESKWLDDYALFMMLKLEHGGVEWRQWPTEYVERDADALERFRQAHNDGIDKIKFRQWISFAQWHELREYASERGVKFIGDIPIFVAMDSADVWANREIFQMDAHGHVDDVSGVPPDYFSETGQKWGNPLYDWEALAESGYEWWLARVEKVLETVDIVRIDHFRGLQAYWAVPAEAKTAVDGEWRVGPADALFETIRDELGEVPFIAEDLGMITEEVIELRDRHELPGMKVLQFADWSDPEHIFLPQNYETNFVAYTGTHDNDTTQGWYDKLDDEQRHEVRSYLSCGDDDIGWSMIEAVFGSDAALAIVPVQDVFGLGTEARMNNPGGNGDNWLWRMRGELLETRSEWRRLGKMTEETNRV